MTDIYGNWITDPKLPSLLKMLIWAQNQLNEKAAYPRINDLSTAAFEDPAVWKAHPSFLPGATFQVCLFEAAPSRVWLEKGGSDDLGRQ